jgi:cyclic nucleotide gated channel
LLVTFSSISNWDTEKQFGGQDDPKGASMFKWHVIFLVSCVIAVLYVDPLFLYLPVINQDHKCLFLDGKLKITAICFRSAFDLIYIAYIILGFRCAYKDKEVSHISGRTVAWKIIKEYLWSYNFLVDILVILPIPQVIKGNIFQQFSFPVLISRSYACWL